MKKFILASIVALPLMITGMEQDTGVLVSNTEHSIAPTLTKEQKTAADLLVGLLMTAIEGCNMSLIRMLLHDEDNNEGNELEIPAQAILEKLQGCSRDQNITLETVRTWIDKETYADLMQQVIVNMENDEQERLHEYLNMIRLLLD